jgi:hypothetical protein
MKNKKVFLNGKEIITDWKNIEIINNSPVIPFFKNWEMIDLGTAIGDILNNDIKTGTIRSN